MEKRDLLGEPIKHIDIASFGAAPIIDSMREMSFTARGTARAADVLNRMVADNDCTIVLCIVGMDFFEAIGFCHYRGSTSVADNKLRELYIDRIYDTFIDEEQLQACDNTIKAIAEGLDRRPYSSREFIEEMGKHLVGKARKKDSLVQTASSKMEQGLSFGPTLRKRG